MFDDMDRGCKVYVWKFGGSLSAFGTGGNVGHAAVLAKAGPNNFDYLSWWPKGAEGGVGRNIQHDRPGGYGARMKWATTAEHSYHMDRARVTDKDREEKSADFKYKFVTDQLDYEEMVRFIKDLANGKITCSRFANSGTWNFLNQNCSTTSAHCLRAGGADAIVPWPGHKIWHPDKVKDYCEKLVAAIGAPGAVQVR